jgi:hypothetical protein
MFRFGLMLLIGMMALLAVSKVLQLMMR